MNILTHLQHLNAVLSKTTLRQMSVILEGMLGMTGRVTMLGISRWTDKGGSYRTVQRFYQTAIPWAQVLWLFFCEHLKQEKDSYLLAGDECVVSKSGKQTYGLDRFFSSLLSKAVPSVALFALALVNTRERRAYPVMVEQVLRSEQEKAAAKQKAQQKRAKKKKPKSGQVGRPKGRKNQSKTKVDLTPELQRIQAMIARVRALVGKVITLSYIVLDGHFGNNNALQMVLQCQLHLVCKLRQDSALYYPYEGERKRKLYGDKLDYAQIPTRYLQASTSADGIRTDIYQAILRHKTFAQPLNVVILVKTRLQTGAKARVLLFSSDLQLAWAQLIDYYQLRFQIEFNFRDAKQFWGLEDFMNVKATPVTNAINLPFLMVNLSHLLLRDLRQADSVVSVLDLKAYYRGHKYVAETLKLLPQKPDPILVATIFDQVSRLGRVHHSPPTLNSS